MTIFNGKRLDKDTFQIDVRRMRRGWYSDAYFSNTERILDVLAKEGYTFKGEPDVDIDGIPVHNGNIEVEMQFFTRRKPLSLVAGVDEALAILEECTGYYSEDGSFVSTFKNLQIEAVHDGTFARYDGDSLDVEPVMRVRGRYRDFARLETPILGVLTEATRIATNVYNTLVAARGKDLLFFPARFAHYKLQALHGYAYSLAVQAYNLKFSGTSHTLVSTNDQGGWWGGRGSGTIAHASIACFLGDASETMIQFSRVMPADVPRIVLVDFHNDCVRDTLSCMRSMFFKYWDLLESGKPEEARRYKLYAVRPDTSGNMRDESVPPIGDRRLDCGVNPRLVWALRHSMDNAWKDWGLTGRSLDEAIRWCKDVKIVVTGGFNVERIRQFEEMNVPVDIYGVGSSLLENSTANDTNNDYTADIVRVKIGDQWLDMAKVGRRPCDNANLEKVQ